MFGNVRKNVRVIVIHHSPTLLWQPYSNYYYQTFYSKCAVHADHKCHHVGKKTGQNTNLTVLKSGNSSFLNLSLRYRGWIVATREKCEICSELFIESLDVLRKISIKINKKRS